MGTIEHDILIIHYTTDSIKLYYISYKLHALHGKVSKLMLPFYG